MVSNGLRRQGANAVWCETAMNLLASKPAKALASLSSNGCAQRGAKFSVMLDMPLATHGFIAGFAAFGVEQNPLPPARRLGAYSCIVLPESPF